MHFVIALAALAFRTLTVPAVIMTATLYTLTCVLIENEEVKRIFLILIGPIMMMAPSGRREKKSILTAIKLAKKIYPGMTLVIESLSGMQHYAAVKDSTPTLYVNTAAVFWQTATEAQVAYLLAHEWAHILQHRMFTEVEMAMRNMAPSSFPEAEAYASANMNEDEAEGYAVLIHGPQHYQYALDDERVQRWLWDMWYLWEGRGHTLPRPKFPYPGATEL